MTPASRRPRLELEKTLEAMMGELKLGDRLPPEPFLARQLKVSRPMLREVLASFVERGLLIRRHGVGTFLSPQTPFLESGLEVLESLDSLARRTGLETEVDQLEILEKRASAQEKKGLGNGLNDEVNVLKVSRVILMEHQPVAYLLDVIPKDYLRKEQVETSIHGSVYDILVDANNPRLAYSRTEIMSEGAKESLASMLKVGRGTALTKIVAQLYSLEGKVVDYSTSYFVPGHFKFHVIRRLSRPYQPVSSSLPVSFENHKDYDEY